MDKQQAQQIVDGLKQAQAAGASVAELVGSDARDFAFLKDEQSRPDLLGTFRVQAEPEYFVSLVSRESGDYGFAVYMKRKGQPIVATNVFGPSGLVWTYKPTKWSGDNLARKKAFLEAAKSDSIVIPFPSADLHGFSAAVAKAIELRHVADAAGGGEDDDTTWEPPDPVLPPRAKLPASISAPDTVPGVVWQRCATEHGATLSQLQEAIDALGRSGSHPAKGMLRRYAKHHGCTITVHGTGEQATYTIAPPLPGSGSDLGAPQGDGALDFEDILDQLRDASLSFSAELVASYLLALQAKRFVLLTGISGTGKTRLAQEIAKMFGPTMEPSPSPQAEQVEIVAKPSQLKYARFIVPSELAQEFDALTDPEIKRIDLKVPGLPLASMAFHKAPERGNLMYVLLSGATKQWFLENIKIGARFLLSKKMAGDKEWLDLALPTDRQPQPALPTYELIAVRPDWTDARALLGFYNPLTRSYQPTPTLRLLLRAHAEVQAAGTDRLPRPFFLIFDEMNLARVEHYFSDFLSVMESGEAIHLHDDPQVEEEEDIPRRITVPRNVFVIGTVNVDETTYMFSPKVLDRAFVLEFNDVDLGGLAGPVQSEDAESTPLALVNLEGGLKLRGQGSGDEWKRFETLLHGDARALLGKIHDALAIENRHFGYRVAREVARFIDLAVEQAGAGDATVRAALDVSVLAKILPKLHGSQGEIEATLKRLLAIATGNKPDGEVFDAHGALNGGVELPLPRTARKLGRMLYRLRLNGFVSFIE